MRTAYPLLLTAWLAAFGFEAAQISRDLSALRRTADGIEGTAEKLQQDSNLLRSEVESIRAYSRESEFLQRLPDVLPQEKGFLRTQKAIADEVEALRQKVGRRLHGELHIVVDTKVNKLYLKRGLTLLWGADCSVGRGGSLYDKATGRHWEFVTPRGKFEVLGKIQNPVWHKPDWAFVEEGKPVPPPADPQRDVPGELGAYVFDLGDGYLIHGTKSESVLGHAVSHGCIRLGADNLKKLYDSVPVGTKVYLF